MMSFLIRSVYDIGRSGMLVCAQTYLYRCLKLEPSMVVFLDFFFIRGGGVILNMCTVLDGSMR